MLRAIHVPGLHRKPDGPLGPPVAFCIEELGEQRRIVFDGLRPAPNLDAPPAGKIHQKQHGPVVLGQIAEGNILLIAGKIGEGERLVVQHLEEAFGAAFVLDVGLAVGTRGGEEEGIAVGYELGELGRHAVGPAALFFHARETAARPEALLRRLDRR